MSSAILKKWSTADIAALFKQIEETEVLPRNNPFFRGQTDMRGADVTFVYTAEEFEELVKCKESVVYFGDNFCKIKAYGEVKLLRDVGGLRPYQKRTLNDFEKYRLNVMLASRQIGKCVGPLTQIEIKDGDDAIRKISIARLYFELKPRTLRNRFTLLVLRVGEMFFA